MFFNIEFVSYDTKDLHSEITFRTDPLLCSTDITQIPVKGHLKMYILLPARPSLRMYRQMDT